LKKLVLLLLVRYVVTHHVITVTNYHFTWCSVVMNVIFNTCVGSIICYIGKFYFEDFFFNCNFKLFGENCMKIITTGQICLSNYELSRFWNNHLNLCGFSSLVYMLKLKLINFHCNYKSCVILLSLSNVNVCSYKTLLLALC
jgi:hypothetical protein